MELEGDRARRLKSERPSRRCRPLQVGVMVPTLRRDTVELGDAARARVQGCWAVLVSGWAIGLEDLFMCFMKHIPKAIGPCPML